VAINNQVDSSVSSKHDLQTPLVVRLADSANPNSNNNNNPNNNSNNRLDLVEGDLVIKQQQEEQEALLKQTLHPLKIETSPLA
jgi:hypothetical protein